MNRTWKNAVLVICFSLIAACSNLAHAQPDPAEEKYQAFLSLYRGESPSQSDLEQSLELVRAAYDLSPSTYKYSFSVGAVNHRLGNYSDAVDWFRKAQALSTTEEQRQSINLAVNDCLTQLAKAKVSTWEGPGLEIAFIMKMDRDATEMSQNIIDNLPQLFPRIKSGESVQPITEILTKRIPGINWVTEDVFLIAGAERPDRLKEHYQRGIKDFYSYFRSQYFKSGPGRIIVVFISPNPYPLLEATRALYPEVDLPLYAPFLGYYNPADNLIMATSGRTGYGTLLHELIHALTASDFPAAPSWLNEGLASLYERTIWRDNRPFPLPNWRFDRSKAETFSSLAKIAKDIESGSYSIADIRMLLLCLDEKEATGDFYNRVKREGAEFDLLAALSAQGITDSEWKPFVEDTLRNYMVEMAASHAALSNPDEVRFLQHALNQIIDAGLEEDGIWGSSTVKKVKEFQRKFGLEPDGVVGKNTRNELKRQFALSNLKAL